VSVFGQQLKSARGVPGQRAELDVRADLRGHRGLEPGDAVALVVVLLRLPPLAEADERNQGAGQDAVRLRVAEHGAVQQPGPGLEGPGVLAALRVPVPDLALLAGEAARGEIARRGDPELELVLRRRAVAQLPGQPVADLMHGARTVTPRAGLLLEVVQRAVDLVERD